MEAQGKQHSNKVAYLQGGRSKEVLFTLKMLILA